MIIFNKYLDKQDLTWYDSSNVIFSKCYDNKQNTKTLKIVFKNGRTYLYKEVDTSDYLNFKIAESNGSAVNTFIIKKYKGVRIADTDINKLEELKEEYINSDKQIKEEPISNLDYHIVFDSTNGNFQLKLNERIIYSGIEGQISIFDLLKSMNIGYSWENVENLILESDEHKEEIIL